MNDSTHVPLARSPSITRSRSGIGRLTGRFARLFGKTGTLQATGHFLRRQLWLWPILAALVLALVGWWVNASVENAMRAERESALTTILQAEVTSLRVWSKEQQINSEMIARDDGLRPLVRELLAIATQKSEPARQLLQAPAESAIRGRLEHSLRLCGYHGFALISPAGIVLACDHDVIVGKMVGAGRRGFFERVLAWQSAVSKPYRSGLLGQLPPPADAGGSLGCSTTSRCGMLSR
jgi:hypothetical protein